MADGFEEQSWVRMGVAATLLREYSADQKAFVGMLGGMLKSALPDETQLLYRGFFKKALDQVRLDLGEFVYVFESPERGGVRVSRAHIVRGIALKTEEITMQEALDELDAALQARSAALEAARRALATTLGLEP